MGEVSTIGLDIAKNLFQIHGVDADGTVVIRKRIGRARVLEFFADLPPCRVGMEACATAHQWARELRRLGHDTRLMPPTYVKAYGLVPRQNSTGGKERLGSISKQGDRYLRRLLVVGATSVINCARARPYKYPWVIELLGRRPTKVVAVALANKMARIAWAVLAKGKPYRSPTRSSNAAALAPA